MNKPNIVLTCGAIAVSSGLCGCSGGAANAPTAVTKQDELNLINKAPMPPGERERITRQIQSGTLKPK